MRRAAVTLLALVAGLYWPWAALVAGQSVKLPEEVRADPGTLAVVEAQTDCKELRWLPLDPGLSLIPSDLLKDSRKAVVMAGRAGRYRLLSYGALGDRASPPATCLVVVGDTPPAPPGPSPGPAPGPSPGPTPVPPPAPPAPLTKLHLLLVEETADAAAGRGKYLSDPALRARVKAKGHNLRVIDKDVTDASGKPPRDLAPYLERARGKGFPQLYLVNQDGRVLYEGALPPTPEELLKLLDKIGG